MSNVETKQKYILVNITEELVKKKVRQTMPTFDMCQCEKCYLDACAISLNNLKPQYVTTLKGTLLTKLSDTQFQYQTDLQIQVINALMAVKNSPRH